MPRKPLRTSHSAENLTPARELDLMRLAATIEETLHTVRRLETLIEDRSDSERRLTVTIGEAAKMLSCTTRHVRDLIRKGELDGVGEGRDRWVTMDSLRRYIRKHGSKDGKHG